MNRTQGTLALALYVLMAVGPHCLSAQQPPGTPLQIGKYKPRYEGTRWALVYGGYEGVQRFAVNELQRQTQIFLPYVLEVHAASSAPTPDYHLLLVGSAANNPLIADLGRKGLITLPAKAEGYTIASLKSPANPALKIAVVAGADDNGVLYGVQDFNRRLSDHRAEDARGRRQVYDNMAEFQISEAPVIEDRGIWTWGYVLYDFRRFVDNMARLRMNRLVIANDVPPLNAAEVIDYAHSRGIKVILAFAWGWGVSGVDLANPEHLRVIKEDVLNNYETNYSRLPMDGIYFQTVTEHSTTKVGGKSTAALAGEWVNEISAALLEKHPGLRIEFGLHATSILENYVDLKNLDARVPIVWEDAGVLPYGRSTSSGSFPWLSYPEGAGPRGLGSLDATLDYSRKLATFRPDNREFAMVAKGFMLLRWSTEFEHHGPFILGERNAAQIRERLQQRQHRWDYTNTRWIQEFPHAMRFYSEIRKLCKGRMNVAALVEDGLFEEKIPISVALFAEMLWNPDRDQNEILSLAMSQYYQ